MMIKKPNKATWSLPKQLAACLTMDSGVKLYRPLKDGQWVAPVRKKYKLVCCDCGSTHTLDFKLRREGRGNRIMFRAFKDEKETNMRRKQMEAPNDPRDIDMEKLKAVSLELWDLYLNSRVSSDDFYMAHREIHTIAATVLALAEEKERLKGNMEKIKQKIKKVYDNPPTGHTIPIILANVLGAINGIVAPKGDASEC